MRAGMILGLWLLLSVAEAAAAEDLRFESLRQLIETRHVERVETLIGLLPPELRTHYALVFSSRSLQDATFENPRAILFGQSAKFILTFNGDAAQRGFTAIETMEFDPGTGRYLFREITFPAGAGPPTISEPNPARCAACHDRPARPIWDVPPLWPGVYGERYGAGLSIVERRGMRGFLAAQSLHPRYRFLVNTAALEDRDTYVASSRDSYNGTSREPPNARLSLLLASLNTRTIVAQLSAQPAFNAYLYALLAAAGANCGPIAGFFPASLQDGVSSDIRDFSAAARAADRRQREAKALRLASGDSASAGAASYSELRYLAERGLGLPTAHWTLAFERGSYDMAAPGGTVSLEAALFQLLSPRDTELGAAVAYRDFNPDDGYCRHLRNRSQSALAGWFGRYPAFPVLPDARSDGTLRGRDPGMPSVVGRCITCHGSGAAPPLPFDDASALPARLRGGNYPHGRLLDEILFRLTPAAASARMPRGINLDPTEQTELENYFIAVAGR